MIRRFAAALIVVASACGSETSDATLNRCRELEKSFTPADAWADIAELQEVAAEWNALGCDEVLGTR